MSNLKTSITVTLAGAAFALSGYLLGYVAVLVCGICAMLVGVSLKKALDGAMEEK